MKKQNNKCKWYVECDTHTNEQLFATLAQKMITEESTCYGLLDGNGIPHNVVKLQSYDNVRWLINNQTAGNYKFKIFFKPEGWEHISHWTLHVPKSKRRK